MRDNKYLTDPPKKWTIIFWCCFALLIAMLVYIKTGRNWYACGIFIMATSLFYAFYVRCYWNYPTLHEEYLVIQNIISRPKKFRYDDIEHATVMHTGKSNVLIIKLRNTRFSRHLMIGCTHNKDLDKLSADLKQKGVNTTRKMSPFE